MISPRVNIGLVRARLGTCAPQHIIHQALIGFVPSRNQVAVAAVEA